MRLTANKVTLASGVKLVNGYKIMLAKSEVEKAGFKAGDELEAQYKKDRIILIKKDNC